MGISTNTYTSVPTCENCGRDKQATYICDACCDKLNAMHRDLLAERNRLAAENAELRNGILPSEVHAHSHYQHVKRQRDAANATLERLREAIRRQHAELFYMTAAQYLSVGFDAKKETDNG